MKIPPSYYGVTRQVIQRVHGHFQQKEQGHGNSLQSRVSTPVLRMLQLCWNVPELHQLQQQLWAAWLQNFQTEISESMVFRSHKTFS